MTARPGEVLRSLLHRPAILELPAICDRFSARLAQDAGYEAVSLAAYAVGAHLPGGSVFCPAEIERVAAAVTYACHIPLLLEADAVCSDDAQLAGAVQRLEAAGVAAIQFSGQHAPDHAVVSPDDERRAAHADLLQRVHASAATRMDAVVVARCDVLDTWESVDRASALLAAGADALLVRAGAEQMAEFPRHLPGAALIYVGPPGGLPVADSVRQGVSPELLEDWGYSALSIKHHRCYCPRLARTVAMTATTPYAARWAR